MDNIIKCICRRYRVQTPGGTVIEVESDAPISSQLNAKLLEEDTYINEFFKHHKVLGIRQMVMTAGPQKDLRPPRIINKDGTLNPRQRLNHLLKMKGEFTRKDYIKFLFDNSQYKLNKWTSHNDIKDALRLNKIELLEDRKGRDGRVYRVVDSTEVEESIYQKLLQDRKLHISTLT